MIEVLPSFKKRARSVLVIFFLLLFLGVFYTIFWLLIKSPSAETVFWETLDNNLNSQSIVLETKIDVDLGEVGKRNILDSRTSLSFAYETGSSLNRKFAIYDADIAQIYVNPLQLETYQLIGVKDLPEQEWSKQEVFAFGDTVYARHNIYTQPDQPDWNNAYDEAFIELPLGETWRKMEIKQGLQSFQHFLMTSMANGGIFLYGKIEPEARARIVTEFKDAYKVDFEKVKTFDRDGRLIYEYEVKLDYPEFGIAFFDYYDANIAEEGQKVNVTEEEIREAFSNPNHPNLQITYTVLIDARAQQLLEVRHPFKFDFGFNYDAISPQDLYVIPYLSPLIRDLVPNTKLKIGVTTKVLSQNQRLFLEPPAAYIGSSVENQEFE